ncbi:hypothetical protein EAF00_007857 [Botryotinia globosa]|nr:hypothetical protein EAF00_007857 [Botryotinia globosa]
MVEVAAKQLEIINAYVYNLEMLGDDDMRRIDVQLACDFLVSECRHVVGVDGKAIPQSTSSIVTLSVIRLETCASSAAVVLQS